MDEQAQGVCRLSPWGRFPSCPKEHAVLAHSPKQEAHSVTIHRMTPKHPNNTIITHDIDAAKKRKWSIGSTSHVTPNSNPSPVNETVNGTSLNSQKKKKNPKLSSEVEDEIFPKLDTTDPVSARRLQQRRRVIAFGKNTVGYDEYRRQVPIHHRKPKSMDHPTTPDHTLDIPNRRWLGLVKAWYVRTNPTVQ